MTEAQRQAILEKVKTSPELKQTFVDIFPELFDAGSVYLGGLELSPNIYGMFTSKSLEASGLPPVGLIGVKAGGAYKDRGFYLNAYYNWNIKRDLDGILVLIPTKSCNIFG